MSSGFITRVEHDKDEPYTVIFTTDDVEKYKAVEDECRRIIGHGKPSVNAMNELIDALRRCWKCPCDDNCPRYEKALDPSIWTTAKCALKLQKDAADAIERLQTENDELRARWSAATIEGFPIKDLMLFAMTCRKNGVREKDLQAFAWNMEKALEIVRKEFDESVRDSIDRMMNGYKQIEEFKKMEGEPNDAIRPN